MILIVVAAQEKLHGMFIKMSKRTYYHKTFHREGKIFIYYEI